VDGCRVTWQKSKKFILDKKALVVILSWAYLTLSSITYLHARSFKGNPSTRLHIFCHKVSCRKNRVRAGHDSTGGFEKSDNKFIKQINNGYSEKGEGGLNRYTEEVISRIIAGLQQILPHKR
jgi:hypothetical protein